MRLEEFRQEVLRKYHVDVVYDQDILKFIVDDNVGKTASTGGAREVLMRISDTVVYQVSRYLNANKQEISRTREILVKKDGTGRYENKGSRKSTARLVVVKTK